LTGVRARPVWLLDLDNTLHDASRHVFPRIDRAMTEYVARRLDIAEHEASALRIHYWRRYGATMLGMVRHHGVDPHEFLREAHPFPDLAEIIARDHGLRDALRRLPGRKIVVTNAPREYARGVLRSLAIAPLLDGLVSIESMRFAGRFFPKPSRAMLAKLIARLRVPASRCVLVEDSAANLAAARACRVRTVLVTGLSHRRVGAARRPRAGRGRRIDVQVQSTWHLPRLADRLP
jgi:putative hydrolase of the HAD superfamily